MPGLFALVGAAVGCATTRPQAVTPRLLVGGTPTERGHLRDASGPHVTWHLDLGDVAPAGGGPPLELDGPALTTGTLTPATAFDELVSSWNVDVPDGSGVAIEARVRRALDGPWSPWLHLGDWGRIDVHQAPRTRFDGGRVDVDVLRLDYLVRSAELRMQPVEGGATASPIVLRRWTVTFTDSSRLEATAPLAGPHPTPVKDVAPRSQRLAPSAIAGRICSPTAVAMALDYFGAPQPTEAVAQRAYDVVHDLYGNWPRAVQTAWSFGVPGWLERFGEWQGVERRLAEGSLLVISVRAAPGELPGAPYTETAGHLMLLLGFDEQGRAVVNDPAADTLASVRRTYDRADLERCWIRRGGIAYVLGPRERAL